MKTARDIAIVGGMTLGINEDRILYLLGDYLGVGDHYLKNPDEELPSDFQNADSIDDFIGYVSLIVRDEEKSAIKGREQRLKDSGWQIHAASTDDRIFIVDNPYGSWQVLHFYQDGPYCVPMVEGFFADSLPSTLREILFDNPEEFVKKFYFYYTSIEPDWSTMELNIYNEPKVNIIL